MRISLKHLFFGILIGAVLLVVAFRSLPDGKLHLIFCNVGQGDAILIRTPAGNDILMDGGPNEAVLSCLGKYLPFYDKSIEMVILSHPQADHLNGLISVLERYSVDYFVSSGVGGNTKGYQQLNNLLSKNKVARKSETSGQTISLDGLKLKTISPSSEEEKVLGASTAEESINKLSLMMELNFGNFSALLTGDADSVAQEQISPIWPIRPISILKVPHHGSKTALLESFLEEIKPQLAVISVGKNSYGHPNNETMKQLSNLGSKILRTDRDGDIEIITDGKNWQARLDSSKARQAVK